MGDVAVIHDYLTQFGGAERVALALCDTFPSAPLYTSIFHPETTFSDFRDLDVRTTSLQRIIPRSHFRLGGPLYGAAFSKLDLSGYDRVLVSTSGFAHHVRHQDAFIYCHTPPRFIYRLDTYFSNRALVDVTRPFVPWLRKSDRTAAARHNNYVANSRATAQRIAELYGKDVDVIHPPLNTACLPAQLVNPPENPRALVVARLQPYKRIDLTIDACRRAGIGLTIVGEGPEESKLRQRAEGHDVKFIGRLSDRELADVFERHNVVVLAGVEDYGMTPVEANYAGRPVLARADGGALETLQEGRTGRLIDADDATGWAEAIDNVLRSSWDLADLRASTEPYQLAAFQSSIRRWMGIADLDLKAPPSMQNLPGEL